MSQFDHEGDRGVGVSGAHPAQDAPEAALIAVIRQELDRSCAGLDGQTLSRLRRIRSKALEQKRSPLARFWLPLGGVLAAGLCAMVVVFNPLPHARHVQGHVQEGTLDVVENVDILAADEGLDFYENYEFYEWLADN